MNNTNLETVDSLPWLNRFPGLLNLEISAREALSKYARIVEAPIGTIGYSEGMPCQGYVMRLSGQSRVYKLSNSGREIQLYRVSGGETCVLTTTCLLGRSDYPASSVVEKPICDVVIPAAVFHQLMIDSKVFRTFVMENYGALISDLIVLLDEVAFHKVDSRLAKLLIEDKAILIKRTHQQIADDLGTAREVISRQLKLFEQNKWLKLGRGNIEILNRQAFISLAANA